MNPITVATEGKGARQVVRRAGAIAAGYGLTPRRMQRRIERLVELAARAGSPPTLPITASAFRRHPAAIRRSIDLGTEFAVHGLHHVDHALLGAVEQIERLGQARHILQDHGIEAAGFRAPYLRWNEATTHALRENGYIYDSSQAMHWPIGDELESEGYRRLLTFSSSLAATDHPAVPRIEEGLVRIACCLPDDESLVERLGPISPEAIADIWLDAERAAYERGELLTLQIHPERVDACELGVEAVLAAAAARRPSVWVATLAEIARWWIERARSAVDVRETGDGLLTVEVEGPAGVTLLARGLDVDAAEPWTDGWIRVRGPRATLESRRRPFIGVDPDSPDALPRFLREQGYIVETTRDPSRHPIFLDHRTFERADELPLLRRLDADPAPLLRLGRWPDAAKSAVAVSGDVDALTIWDYALRFAGR
jgi:peptidoglycan/xylan/chitin deacetylase (PgdA/CDA1 family)